MAVEFDKAFADNAAASGEVESTALALTAAALGFTAAQLGQAVAMVVTCFDQDVLWTVSGTAPVVAGSRGHLLAADGELVIRGRENIENFKVISTTGTAVLFVTLFNPDPA